MAGYADTGPCVGGGHYGALRMADYTYSVAELGREVGRVVDAAFPTEIWVRGEIRNLSRSPVEHVYFDLVDPDRTDALLPVVLLRANKEAVNRHLLRSGAGRMVDGTEVRIGGFVSYYGARGVVQLRMTRIDADYTLGRLAAARDELLRRLAAEGLLGRNALLRPPALPLRVGLVTSVGSAAAADFLGELEASGYGFTVLLADARVQGPDASASLVTALADVARRDVDVVALVRGGGSRTDLAAFDGEPLARGIASCPVPVLTGVGHEVDDTVADRIAHASFKTPTACAAALVAQVSGFVDRTERAWAGIARLAEARLRSDHEHAAAVAARIARAGRAGLRAADAGLDVAGHRLRRAARGAVHAGGRRVDGLAGRLAAEAAAACRAHTAAVGGHRARLTRAALRLVRDAEAALDGAGSRVRALDPAQVLARGWSITRDAHGRAVRSVGELRVGDALVTTFTDGEAASRVTDVRPGGRE